MFAFEKLIFLSVNFSISYASRAKALTTRLPEMFSWVVVFSWDSRSRRSMYIGRTRLANRKDTTKTGGDRMSIHSVSLTSMVKK
ncbi:hypothetical protein D3C73_1322990 [compost metagenome]